MPCNSSAGTCSRWTTITSLSPNDGSSASSSQPRRTPGTGAAGGLEAGTNQTSLPVAVALGAPGLAGAGHDAEPATEGRELVEELLADLERREGRRVGRRVAHLDARVAPVPRSRTVTGGLAVEDRVGDDLGQGQLGVLAQLGPADLGHTPATQRRACIAPRGPGASGSAGRFSGTVSPHVQAR